MLLKKKSVEFKKVLNLASEQQDASVGHDSGLTHAPDVLRLRIVPPLGLAYM